MRVGHIPEAIRHCLQARRPLMLHGSPGIGKSRIVHTVAGQLDRQLIDLRLSQLEPVDLRGVPSVDTVRHLTQWNPPDFLPREGRGILFLDELPNAPQATQAAGYQLILDRRLGDYALPPEWDIIAAGNLMTDRALVNRMSSALNNRFTHITVEVNPDDWCRWAIANGICDEVIGFIRFRPMLLSDFTKRNNSAEEAQRLATVRDQTSFASPRSWEYLSDIFKTRPQPALELEMYSGNVGEGIAAEFMGYVRNIRDMPNLDTILLAPDQARVPTDPATLYAVTVGLASRATVKNFDRVMQYAAHLPPEFQALLTSDAGLRTPAVLETAAFQLWATNNAKAFI